MANKELPDALTFIIPVRHHANASDWDAAMVRLLQTAASISAQSSGNWRAVVVANECSGLPDLPKNFSVVRVDYPPNASHKKDGISRNEFYEAFRFDKGRRVLAGMLYARPLGHIMIVDDDDFVHRNLAKYVSSNPENNGWSLTEGWIWPDGGDLVYRSSRFNMLCGTSHIIRADLYAIPSVSNEASDDYIKYWLGSHIFIESILKQRGIVLEPLPFAGAVYRVGHAGAHSQSSGSIGEYIDHAEDGSRVHGERRIRFRNRSMLERFWGKVDRRA
jgi:hypothetical protein